MIKLFRCMSLQISLPLGNKAGVKNLVFTLLTKEYPLKLIELMNFIRKRYGRIVTFQAVRKAVLELVEEGVLVKEETAFSINREWITQAKGTIDTLYEQVHQSKSKPLRFDAIGEEVSVFSFDSLGAMMRFWEDLIDSWFKKYVKSGATVNAWQGTHPWEGLLYPDRERAVMEQLKKKGIKSYVLCMSGTLLDKAVMKFYKSLGISTSLAHSSSLFDKEYYVGTYGELVVQTRYPPELVRALDMFFKKVRGLEHLNMKELSDIINRKVEVKLSVTKNSSMAKQINHSILSQM